MTSKLSLAVVLAASVLTGAANAAELLAEEPAVIHAPVADFDWTGLDVGVQGSYFLGTTEWNNIEGDLRSATGDANGTALGFRAGVDYDMGSLVLGVSAEYNVADIEGTGDFADDIDYYDVKISGFGSVDARLGVDLGRVLPFITAGIAVANVQHTYFAVEEFGPSAFTGYQVGVGVDLALTDSLIGRAQYRYADYGSVDYEPNGGPSNVDHSLDLTANILTLGLGYKF